MISLHWFPKRGIAGVSGNSTFSRSTAELQPGEEEERWSPTAMTKTLRERCVPGPRPMQLDKSKQWTGGVGMVLE